MVFTLLCDNPVSLLMCMKELPCESCENVGVIQNKQRVYNKNRVLFMM